MEFQPNTTQLHVLLRLLFTGEEPLQSKVQPKLEPKLRKEMIEARLIDTIPIEKGRGEKIVLLDRAWKWMAEHLDMKIPGQLKIAAPALEGLLHKIHAFLQANDLTLVDLISARQVMNESLGTDSNEEDVPENYTVESCWSPLQKAYFVLSGGQSNKRVRLSELRKRIPDIPREIVDRCLLEKQKEGRLVLYQLDDPLEIYPDDNEAAIDVAGYKRHIIYMWE